MWHQKVREIKDNYNPNIMLIDCKQVKINFNDYLEKTRKAYEDYLVSMYQDKKEQISQTLTSGGKFSFEKSSTEKICKFVEDINEFNPTLEKLKINVGDISTIYNLIKTFNISTLSQEDHTDYENSFKNAYVNLSTKLQGQMEEINKLKDNQQAIISTDIKSCQTNIIKLNEVMQTNAQLLDDKTDRQNITTILTDYKGKIDNYKTIMDKNIGYLTTLKFNVTSDIQEDWNKLNEGFDIKNSLWETLIDLEDKFKTWKNFSINDMKNAKIDDQIRDFNITVTNIKLKITKIEDNKVLTRLISLITDINKYGSVVQVLSSTSMQERHWKEFFKILSKDYTPELLNTMTFGELLHYEDQLFVESDKIDNISAAAIAQEKIMKDIEKITTDWQNIKFEVTNQSKTKNETKYVIKDVTSVNEKLDEHSQLITSGLSSRHVNDIRAIVEEWYNNLSNISAILEDWLFVQKQWIYLENIFSAEDIKKQLPEASSQFARANKSFKELMHKTYNDPNVLNRCKQDGLKNMLVK